MTDCQGSGYRLERIHFFERALETIRVLPPWVEESPDLLQKGGQTWMGAEKAKMQI